ncbi:sensor histidine kinase [Nonomuraea sp. SYSU D8015]|uniref:sensor histidine kinase n=1 Tax=Nonomuraea sp. SYSU D8015 TaxID=2593644 RepID=UPI0016612FCF|nr:ATP-binding protein [Nonomuraea sp. SYSU D8015]
MRAVATIAVRLGALGLCGSLELLGDWRWTTVWPVNVLLAALVLNSLVICALIAVRRALPSRHLLAADVVLVLVVCLAVAWYAGDRMTNGWPGIVLPYVLLSAVMVGIGFRSDGAVAGWAAVLGCAFMVGDVLAGQRWFESLPHVCGVAANAAVACYVATVLTRNAAELDRARAEEVLRTAQLSEERERARTARVLHDRILQTLEALVRDGWIADEGVRARVAEESRWLRAYLRGDEGAPDGDVLTALEAVVRQAVGNGLHVEFNASRLRTSPDRERVAGEVVDALAGALREALTNVAKHAGVRRAVVWAESRAGVVTLSVLDHGAGFDMERRPPGLGISRSIVERVAAVGGSADIESAPGEGTHVTVRIPLPPPQQE